MNFLTGWQRSAAASLRLLGALALCCTLPLLLWAAGPAWWTERGVSVPNKEATDFAAINQGQLKRIALAAFDEFDAKLTWVSEKPNWSESEGRNHKS